MSVLQHLQNIYSTGTLVARATSTRLENITLKKNFMVLIFKESLGQKREDAPNWVC